MRFLPKLFILPLVLMASCSKVNHVPSNCRMATFTDANGNGQYYTFDNAGVATQQILRQGGSNVDTLVYTYNSSGRLDKITGKNYTFSYAYGSDGNVSLLTMTNASGLVRTETHDWYADSIVMKYTHAGGSSPYWIRKMNLTVGKVTKETDYSYSGTDLVEVQIWEWTDFDTNLSPWFIECQGIPGLPLTTTTNNPRKTILTTTDYSSGVAGTAVVVTITGSFAYQNNLLAAETDTYSTGEVYNSLFSYTCLNHE